MSENRSANKVVELVSAAESEISSEVLQRRWCVALVTAGISVLGLWLMSDMLGANGWTGLELVQLFLFALLFTALAFGFTQAFLGFLVLADGQEPLKITNTLDEEAPLASTAIVMPIYNENADTVFGNLQALYESLRSRGELDSFDFYILSDSTDPAKAVEEELAWADLCRQTSGFGKIYYRRRKLPVNRKSGNIADFCRRWGHRHRYMVVLDADSMMTGQAVSSLVRLMEANPRAGIIQTMPRLIKAETLFGRLQQFASRLYSPIFAAGLNFWQQGAGNYWGHNAIIRVSPFLSSCGLPSLPGTEPLGGKVLSHDFVEAALMRNAGWEVWFAYDLEGSYEGLPPTLTEYMKRDRRWCQGNLQHVWFLLARNMRSISRLHLIQGILAYASSPLLVGFILIGGLQTTLDHFHHHARPFPQASAAVLFITTMSLLFGPKVLSLLHLFSRPKEVAAFGGTTRLLLSVLFETLFSIVSAPIMIWFHTRFVLRNLSGQTVTWTTQMRQSDTGPRWVEIIAEYWPLPLVGIGIALLAWSLSPAYLAWLSPLLLGLILSIPLAKLSGHPRIFQHLFVTPEESEPIRELAIRFTLQLRDGDQFIHALVDPFYNAVHVALQRQREGQVAAMDDYLSDLAEKLFRDGPDALRPQEKRALLSDGAKLAYLHTRIWKTPAQMMSPIWSEALSRYRAHHRSVRPEPAVIEARLASAQPFAA